ncbi:MAG: hypothetical protein MJK10_15695 [Pseudomonadales bacterium]|nr:hypothetical protein [Pseudomonadales bacterium]NRA17552.1 hypothetical protein [Oceanospirillaceae bacterium]
MKYQVFVLCFIFFIEGCSNTQVAFQNVSSVPVKSTTSLSNVLACTKEKIATHNQNTAYLIIVREMVDGTVRERSTSDGPLGDAGVHQLQGALVSLLTTEKAIIVDNQPSMFSKYNRGSIGLNKFGVPKNGAQLAYKESMLNYVNAIRTGKGIRSAESIVILTVSGAFTRIDSANLANDGYGLTFGANGSGGKGDLEFGTSVSKKVISLSINLIRPMLNTVIKSQSFDLEFSNSSKKYNLKGTVGEVDLGLALSNTSIESMHSAQQTLIDASAIWLVESLFSGATTSCLTAEIV